MDIESVNERFGADIVVTRNTCTNENGEVILEAFTTLMGHEGDNSIRLKWDTETGQVVRTGVISIGLPAPGSMYTRTSGFSQYKRAVRRFAIDRTGSARVM